MRIARIVVASNESNAARRAVETGLAIAQAARARVTVLRVAPLGAVPIAPVIETSSTGEVPVDTEIVLGVPSIEICRFAEDSGGDLLVLGRDARSWMARPLLGETADAVARRSRLPCLFVPSAVPSAVPRIARILAAVDGTVRGMAVLRTARDFARAVSGSLRLVTVEVDVGEPVQLAAPLPTTRSERLIGVAHDHLHDTDIVDDRPEDTPSVVDVRRGDRVQQILAAVRDNTADLLVIGYHRGGLPGSAAASGTARRLVHAAPCAVLTVPL